MHRHIGKLSAAAIGLSTWLVAVPAMSGAPSPRSRDAVVRLYRDHAFEVAIEDPVLDTLWTMPPEAWKKYFSKRMVDLYALAWKCAKKDFICTTEVSPIWYSQDAVGSTVSIKSTSTETVVIATIHFPADAIGGKVAELKYQMVREGSGWTIDDILYPDGTSLSKWLADAVKQ